MNCDKADDHTTYPVDLLPVLRWIFRKTLRKDAD